LKNKVNHNAPRIKYAKNAIDYLIKPVKLERFQKGVDKAQKYYKLFNADYANNNIENITDDYFFIKANRKIVKVHFNDIIFIEGLKDYVVMTLPKCNI
jgi:two-component system LytT family response regulator